MYFRSIRPTMPVRLAIGFAFLASVIPAQDQTLNIPLTVSAGAPLRLYLTKRVTKRLDAPVQAKVLTPLFAFDRVVVPAGTQVFGHVSRLEPVSRWMRFKAVVGGDFTPLHIAEIEFTSMVLPDGRRIEIQTAESPGLSSLVPLKPPRHKNPPAQTSANTGLIGSAKQKAQDQINQIKSIPDLVRGTDKKDWFYSYAMSRLPYHPQYIWNRTRFDAVLKAPLDFGTATIQPKTLAMIGTEPAPGSIAHARLVTSLDSLKSKPGEKVQAVLEQPVFSADQKLVLPEGTIVHGTVGMARRAGWFHHSGRLRFTFNDIELTQQVVDLRASAVRTLQAKPDTSPRVRTQAQLTGAEGANAPVKVDSEGGAQAKESKTRFAGLAAALLITRSASDNDSGRNHLGPNGQTNQNVSGRTLGGGLGFGLFGSIAAQTSNNVGMALGYYGMAWSVFSTVIARGPEVEFERNAAIDIGFNPRTR